MRRLVELIPLLEPELLQQVRQRLTQGLIVVDDGYKWLSTGCHAPQHAPVRA